jgi:hypothetical protein
MLYDKSPNQPWPGYVPVDSLNPGGGNMGETSPRFRQRVASQYGRNLAGLGESEGYDGDSTYRDDLLEKIQREDDTYGSGVFDPPGHAPTVNGEDGVFEDNPNLPGYLGRETPFRPSSEIESIPSGAQVMTVPAGGMTWGGRLIGGGVIPTVLPTTPIPGHPLAYSPTTTSAVEPVLDVPSVSTVSNNAIMPLRPMAPPMVSAFPQVQSVPTTIYDPATRRPGHVAMVPTTEYQPPSMRPMTVSASGIRAPIFTPPARLVAASAIRPRAPMVPMQVRSMKGFGDDDSSPGVMPYIVGGALLGASIAILRSVMKSK